MSKWGSVHFKELRKMQAKLEKLGDMQQAFCEAAAKELAARLLTKVIKRTPVGDYPKNSGMMGGTLRRGWTGESQKGAAAYANALPVSKHGNTYVIDIINPVEYASYVEFGHRTRGHNGWVPGRFMLTESEAELDAAAPKILEKKLAKWLVENLT